MPKYSKEFIKSLNPKRSVAALNRKVNRLARRTKPERKHAAFNSTAANVDYDGGIQPLVSIGPGTTDEQRVGNRVRLTYMVGRGVIQAVGVSGARVRIILYRDHNSLVTAPLSVLRYVGDQGCISPYNDDTRQDFTILSDKTYHVQPGTEKDSASFNFSRKINKTVLWNDAAGIEENNIKMLAISSHPTGSSSKPLLSYSGQFFYTDV